MTATVDRPSRVRIQDMNASLLPTIARFSVDSLEVLVFENRATAGRAASLGVAEAIADRLRSRPGQYRVRRGAQPE